MELQATSAVLSFPATVAVMASWDYSSLPSIMIVAWPMVHATPWSAVITCGQPWSESMGSMASGARQVVDWLFWEARESWVAAGRAPEAARGTRCKQKDCTDQSRRVATDRLRGEHGPVAWAGMSLLPDLRQKPPRRP